MKKGNAETKKKKEEKEERVVKKNYKLRKQK